MINDVLISITGTHKQDGQKTEPVKMEVRGRYYFRNGHHYVLYEEEAENSGEESIRSMIRFDGDVVEVTRKGAVGTKMHFEEGKRTKSMYKTPVGTLDLEIETGRINLVQRENAITVETEYALHADGKKIQDSAVKIEVLPYPFL